MLSNKVLAKSESLIQDKKAEWVDKIEQMDKRTPEELVEMLSNSLFKLILFLGVPYFIFVLIQYILK